MNTIKLVKRPVERRKKECDGKTVYLIKEKIRNASINKWGSKSAINLIGIRRDFQDVVLKLEKLATCDKPLLIYGESGAGKEIIARSIYLLSRRNNHPFITVNCAQFHDDQLLLSELFGHKKGSFTGAFADHKGVFEEADSGYIFLDEIGELSLNVQSKLLRVIEQKEIRQVGSSISKTVDIRMIMATHRDLTKLLKEGKFREDLFYRLHCHIVRIPPLRKRREDILLFAEYFMALLNEQHGVEKKLSSAAVEFFNHYDFPGNIRELQNMVERGWWNSAANVIELSDFHDEEITPEKDDDIDTNLFSRITSGKESFWELVYEPFMRRDLNRMQVKKIIQKGLETAESNQGLCDLFHIEAKDHQTFINFLYKQKIRSG